jgi:hypothetical protein
MTHERPWEMVPETIEEMMLALLDIEQYESKTGAVVSIHDAPIVTRALFKDMGQRILRLEQMRGLNETV